MLRFVLLLAVLNFEVSLSPEVVVALVEGAVFLKELGAFKDILIWRSLFRVVEGILPISDYPRELLLWICLWTLGFC